VGQRLNVEIHFGKNLIANAYYHWSAFSEEALNVIEPIIKPKDDFQGTETVLSAIRMLESTGAGLTDDEIDYIKHNLENLKGIVFQGCNGRNDGLIAVSPKGKGTTRFWEEGRITIHVDSKTFDYSVLHAWPIQEYQSDYGDEDGYVPYPSLPVFNFDMSNIPFDKFDEFKKRVKGEKEHFKLPSRKGMVFRFIR
jgi:hypothetical protein